LDRLGLPPKTGTGGMTKYNRIQKGYLKAHRIDAACVGESGAEVVLNPKMPVPTITATERGSGQMCRVDKHGFPRSKPKVIKRVNGFQTGDMVRVVIEKGKYRGLHEGRAAVRERGCLDIVTPAGERITTSWKRLNLLQRFDGYTYDCRRTTSSV
jgi:hypothetical protein